MSRLKITDLLDAKKLEKHQPELLHYFERGGTWKDLLNLDDALLEAEYKIAYDFYQSANFQKASAAFSYLTLLNPYNFTYWMGLALAKQSERSYEEAIVAYTVAEAITPDHPVPHLHLSQCYFAIGQKDLSLLHLKEAVRIAGSLPAFQEVKVKAETLLNAFPR